MKPGPIRVGDMAPDFVLPSHEGREVRLGAFRGKKAVVLFFYPKDGTPGCTKEACTFRDQYEIFREKGAEVIGVSSDGPESHRSFSSRHSLPFLLLADEGSKVRRLFGVPSTFGLLPGRVTYLIDKRGVVRQIFSSQWNPSRHVAEALRVLDGVNRGISPP